MAIIKNEIPICFVDKECVRIVDCSFHITVLYLNCGGKEKWI